MGRLSRDKRDIFYRFAKEQGYRARSAFKLLQLDAEFDIFRNVRRVVDLCAAPGSWSQVLVDQLNDDNDQCNLTSNLCCATTTTTTSETLVDTTSGGGCHMDPTNRPSSIQPRIVAVDLQPMAPIDGVHIIQGDITSIQTAHAIIAAMNDGHEQQEQEQQQRAELVVCDGAPDVTGLHDVDEYLQSQLLFAAMFISTHVLCDGGTLVAKIFRGPNVTLLYTQLRILFRHVRVAKPTSCRNSSMESFVVCEQFVGAPYRNLPLDMGGYINLQDYVVPGQDETSLVVGIRDIIHTRNNIDELSVTTVPFVACSDLSGWSSRRDGGRHTMMILDADKSYPMELSEHIAPIAPPIEPPYQASIKKQKEWNVQKKGSTII
jgi:tRNA (cytidine32/guanosine34-2'-O)-methyltransferase